jgi:putative protein-disulfide isomerase
MEAATATEKDKQEITRHLTISYYTDPLCCWSWALQPAWSRLQEEYGDQITTRYVMGCMIVDWQSYRDPVNIVSRPFQMGAVWMHAATVGGVPIQYDVWHKDPPMSSYPSCLAVKCASLQSEQAAEQMLNDLRQAVMKQGLNISREDVILELADALSERSAGTFSAAQFLQDWKNDAARAILLEDIEETRRLQIDRFPTLIFGNELGPVHKIVGFRPYDMLQQVLRHVQHRVDSK